MRIVVDTNVLISGVFFSGPPYEILDAWRKRRVQLVVSPEVLEEYRRVAEELADRFAGVDPTPWLELLGAQADLVEAPPVDQRICSDPDDDKFIACALASGSRFIVTGDRALLNASGFEGVSVLTPRHFVERHLRKRGG